MQYKLAVAPFSLSIYVRPLALTISPNTKKYRLTFFATLLNLQIVWAHEVVTKLGIFKRKTVIAKSL